MSISIGTPGTWSRFEVLASFARCAMAKALAAAREPPGTARSATAPAPPSGQSPRIDGFCSEVAIEDAQARVLARRFAKREPIVGVGVEQACLEHRDRGGFVNLD